MKKLVFALALAISALSVSPALAWNATIVHVTDGDTVTVLSKDTGEKIRVRLYGVDTPEGPGKKWKAQPYSRISTNFLKNLLPISSPCTVLDMGFDRYSRTVGGIITLPDGKVVQEELLRAGLAWVDPRYCKDCHQWKAMQQEARTARRGLWKDMNHVPPWVWRQ